MIWIITICTALSCQTYAFNTEEQCQAYANAVQTQSLSCTPMILWKKENNGNQTGNHQTV
jgi:hypothetical protein